jgi:hypothetical protein
MNGTQQHPVHRSFQGGLDDLAGQYGDGKAERALDRDLGSRRFERVPTM